MHFEPHCEAGSVEAGPVQPPPNDLQIGGNSIFHRMWPLTASMALCALLLVFPAFGLAQATQTGAPGPTTNGSHETAKKHAPHHRAKHRAHKKPGSPEATATPVSTPPIPVPPAKQLASPAKIEFQDGRLQIDAQNSSLVQILTRISGETGLVVEGLGHDERVYGQYGPASVAGTLMALLDGAGYNYVIIGGNQGSMKLLLTPRTAGTVSVASGPAAVGNPTAPAVNTTPVMANPSEPPHPKTPQEIFNELRRMHPQ